MRIGAMADTHDNLPMIRRAVEAFNAEQVELVIHAGDIVAPFALRPLDELIVYGHTHQVDIQKRERALIVNPGEGGGWLYGRATIAVIELDDMKAEVIDL